MPTYVSNGRMSLFRGGALFLGEQTHLYSLISRDVVLSRLSAGPASVFLDTTQTVVSSMTSQASLVPSAGSLYSLLYKLGVHASPSFPNLK